MLQQKNESYKLSDACPEGRRPVESRIVEMYAFLLSCFVGWVDFVIFIGKRSTYRVPYE